MQRDASTQTSESKEVATQTDEQEQHYTHGFEQPDVGMCKAQVGASWLGVGTGLVQAEDGLPLVSRVAVPVPVPERGNEAVVSDGLHVQKDVMPEVAGGVPSDKLLLEQRMDEPLDLDERCVWCQFLMGSPGEALLVQGKLVGRGDSLEKQERIDRLRDGAHRFSGRICKCVQEFHS